MNSRPLALAEQHYACSAAPLSAVLLREFRAALLNRYVQILSFLSVAGGFAAVVLNEDSAAAAFVLVQVALYFVSLFALLAGVSSARAEAEEWPIFFAQPTRRSACVLGKFCALGTIFAGALALLFLPALLSGGMGAALAELYAQTLALAAFFGGVGLCAGFFASDRVQGLVISVGVWLLLLFGIDLVALFAARWAPLQQVPDAWVALLMLNPLDAYRIQALFALEQIPPETADKTALAHWWLGHAGWWLASLCAAWSGLLLLAASRHLERSEI